MNCSRSQMLVGLLISWGICLSALADEKYTIHENLQTGQKLPPCTMTSEYKDNSTSTTRGYATVTNTDTQYSWKLTVTVVEAKNGSAVRCRVDMDAGSFDTEKNARGEKEKSPCPFAGKTIVFSEQADGSYLNDFQGEADDDEMEMLEDIVTPDSQWYPDVPVAVGETWDDSAKVSHYESLGPRDRLTSKGKLTWVGWLNGKQTAQVVNTVTVVSYDEDNVREDEAYTTSELVDLATGITVKFDQKGISKYSTQPRERTQVTGGTDSSFHIELLPDAPAAASTQPAAPGTQP